jgi:activator of HSP90 ATPase
MNTTRRRAFAAIAGTLAATALPRIEAQQPGMATKPANSANASRTAIHYEIDFKPGPDRIYQAILDQKQFAAFSGLPATIDPTAGGAFSQFGGLIVGRNVELVANQRIVQAWRPTHWDPGVYSIVHFEFKPGPAGTSMVFDHIGFPAGEYDSLDSGWQSHYWGPLKKYFV